MTLKIHVSDLDYGEEEVDAVISVIRSQWMTMGPLTSRFEKMFRQYVEYPFAVATSSGTAALHLAIMEANINPGDEVITSPISFVASANCILYEGAHPIFADINPQTWNIDPIEIKAQISSKTKAILTPHLGGLPVALDEIVELCEEKELILIEDAAHAVGARFKGKHVGCFGDFGCFSFFSNKNLSTGEGGMIIVRDSDRYENLLLRRSHGLTKSTWSRHLAAIQEEDQLYDMTILGHNYRIGEMQAALGIEQLKRIDKMNSQRTQNFNYYCKRIEEENLVDFIQLQQISKDVVHAHHIFPIVLKKGSRMELREFLFNKGIGTSIHYTPIPSFFFYRNLGYDVSKYPQAKDFGTRTMTLPLHQKLKKNDIDYIVAMLKKFFK